MPRSEAACHTHQNTTSVWPAHQTERLSADTLPAKANRNSLRRKPGHRYDNQYHHLLLHKAVPVPLTPACLWGQYTAHEQRTHMLAGTAIPYCCTDACIPYTPDCIPYYMPHNQPLLPLPATAAANAVRHPTVCTDKPQAFWCMHWFRNGNVSLLPPRSGILTGSTDMPAAAIDSP